MFNLFKKKHKSLTTVQIGDFEVIDILFKYGFMLESTDNYGHFISKKYIKFIQGDGCIYLNIYYEKDKVEFFINSALNQSIIFHAANNACFDIYLSIYDYFTSESNKEELNEINLITYIEKHQDRMETGIKMYWDRYNAYQKRVNNFKCKYLYLKGMK